MTGAQRGDLAERMIPPARCVNPKCGKVRQPTRWRTVEGARGLCRACHTRWAKAGYPGTPETGVPDPKPLGGEHLAMQERREQYGWLRDRGWSLGDAREELWVAQRTAERYERWYQAQREAAGRGAAA